MDTEIKIPEGAIVKVAGHPVQLKTSLYIKDENIDFFLEKHEILNADFGRVKKRTRGGHDDEQSIRRND